MYLSLLTVFLLTAVPAAGQTIGTECWTTSSGTVQCNTQAGILYAPEDQSFQRLAGALAQIMEARRQAQFSQAMLEAYAAQREAALEAMRTDLARVESDRRLREEAAREQTRRQNFAHRAATVIAELAESLQTYVIASPRFALLVSKSVEDLYRSDPGASPVDIRQWVRPKFIALRLDYSRFVQRMKTPLTEARLRSAREAINPTRRDALERDLARVFHTSFMDNPGIEPLRFAALIDDALAAYHL